MDDTSYAVCRMWMSKCFFLSQYGLSLELIGVFSIWPLFCLSQVDTLLHSSPGFRPQLHHIGLWLASSSPPPTPITFRFARMASGFDFLETPRVIRIPNA